MNQLQVLILPFILFGLTFSLHAQGVVKGRVVFEGSPPLPEKVEVKSDVPTCGSHKDVQKLVLGADRGVANAVVSL